MFGWFKRRLGANPLSADKLILLPNSAFTEITVKVVERHPADAAMIVVAIENLKPLLGAIIDVAKAEPGSKGPKSLDDLIGFFAERVNGRFSEVQKRRFTWFLFAAMILRSTQLAETDRSLEDTLAKAWIHLATGGGYLHELLPNNVLWTKDEKVWFAHLRNDQQGIDYVLVHMMPKWLRTNGFIQQFANENDSSIAMLS